MLGRAQKLTKATKYDKLAYDHEYLIHDYTSVSNFQYLANVIDSLL